MAQRLGLPPRRRRRALTFVLVVLVLVLSSLVWLGSLITARPSPITPDASHASVMHESLGWIEQI